MVLEIWDFCRDYERWLVVFSQDGEVVLGGVARQVRQLFNDPGDVVDGCSPGSQGGTIH